MVAIFGSGFGLYGYLPAIVQGCRRRVVLPRRYQAEFGKRLELAYLSPSIVWVDDERDAIKLASTVVLAQRPADNAARLIHCLESPTIQRLLVEKPLGRCPLEAAALLKLLRRRTEHFRIGYTFRYTDWGRRILSTVTRASSESILQIEWYFMAYHFRHNVETWKRSATQGGGAIRFYGIHLIALMAEAGYREITDSWVDGRGADLPTIWVARLRGPNLPECMVHVDSNSERECFMAKLQPSLAASSGATLSKWSITLNDPFGQTALAPVVEAGLDRRHPVLTSLCQDLFSRAPVALNWYESAIQLWSQAEALSN